MDEAAMRALITRFFDAIERGDIDTVATTYAPDAVIWHNGMTGAPVKRSLIAYGH